jgi:hypothetical protein
LDTGIFTGQKRRLDCRAAKKSLLCVENEPRRKIHNAGPPENYEDEKKLAVVQAEKNITLFLSTRANGVEMDGHRIAAVIAQDIRSRQEVTRACLLVADCTGDGVIGALAGADYAYGRESKGDFDEENAPPEADKLVMGTSVQWYRGGSA